MAPRHLRLLTCVENFQDWYEGIVIELRLQGVFRVVSAEFTRPVIPVLTEENPVHPSDIRAAVALIKQWDDDNSKAIGIIHAALSAPIRHEFMHLTDGNQLLRALKERYEIVNSVFSFEGLQTAISTTYPRCKDIYDYIEKMSARLIVSTRVWHLENSFLDLSAFNFSSAT